MTTKQQQDKQIIENAPEGATHIDTNKPIFYYKINEFVTEYFIGGIWKDACNVIPAAEDIRSLADIREIVALRDNKNKADAIRDAVDYADEFAKDQNHWIKLIKAYKEKLEGGDVC